MNYIVNGLISKKKYKKKKITEETKNGYCTFNFQLFQDFTDGASIEDLVYNYNKKCHEGWNVTIKNSNRWLLSFPNKIIILIIADLQNFSYLKNIYFF